MGIRIFLYIRSHLREIIKFCIVGVATLLLNCGLVWLFYGKAALDYRFAVTYAYFITVVAHFMLNRSFTYGRKGGGVAFDTVRYTTMLLCNYFITLFVTTMAVEVLGLLPYFGVLFSVFVTAFSSFLLMKHFVFVRVGTVP